ncbi:MAG: LysR family transcriptional regulator [Pseudomonadota bacterium]
MSDRLPPLAWIRAFREAGRQSSFRAAAAVLHVSPSTISHEIRRLEDWLGQPLFDRQGRRVTLTAAGRDLHAQIDAGFAQLEAGFAALRGTPPQALRLGVFPFVASEFLLPRLSELEALTQGQPIELVSTTHISDLMAPGSAAGTVDAVIRYVDTLPPDLVSIELTTISLGPIAAAATTAMPTQRIQIDGGFDAWRILQDAGVTLPELPLSATRFDSYLSGLKAIEQGYGLGVIVLPLSAAWLASGRVRLLHPDPVPIPQRYALVFAPDNPHQDVLVNIGTWLTEEFRQLSQMIPKA